MDEWPLVGLFSRGRFYLEAIAALAGDLARALRTV
jgi:hypothetical protein